MFRALVKYYSNGVYVNEIIVEKNTRESVEWYANFAKYGNETYTIEWL